MKKLILTAFTIIFVLTLNAQTDGLSYQAVIIDNNPLELPGSDIEGLYLSNGEVQLRFTIYQNTGDVLYQEVHNATTDAFGMVNLIIGQGDMTAESNLLFTEIDWDGLPKDLGVEVAYDNTDFEELSRQGLLFLPYAFHRNITATGTLDVDGVSTLNADLNVENGASTLLTGSLEVEGTTTLGSDLTVINSAPTLLTGSLVVDGETTLGNALTVADSAPTVLTGSLDVQGDSNFDGKVDFEDIEVANTTILNGPVSVLNESPTVLSGNLNVDGNTILNGPVSVLNESPAFFSGDLTADGTTVLNSSFSVLNDSPTSLTGNLTVEGNTTLNDPLSVNTTSALNGQVTINANTDGSQSSYGSYPLRVQGSNQGIAVRVDGSETETKNFVSFFNGSGTIKGRIEGQTLGELQSSFRFIWDVTMGGLEQAFIVAEGVACGVQLDLGEAGVMTANAALYGAQWVELTANYELNVGVAFLSGGADYAEWLKKENSEERLHPGEVVGVKNGRVSKKTTGMDHYLAVSTNPIVLGNMPPEGEEDAFEKIAFLGQVPIRVVGKVEAGDYILPSGNNDGMAIAQNADELPTQRFKEIIGVAWESSYSDAPTLVNVALGLNKNDLSDRISSLQSEMQELKTQMAQVMAMLSGEAETVSSEEITGKDSAVVEVAAKPLGAPRSLAASKMTEQEFEAWLDEYGYIFEDQMSAIRIDFEERNIDYNRFEEIALVINSPLEALRKMQDGTFLPTLWDNFESRIKAKQ